MFEYYLQRYKQLYLQQYKKYGVPKFRCYDEEVRLVKYFQKLYRTSSAVFYRSKIPAHFTASVIVISQDNHILLHLHQKLQQWVQFGGHVDGEENFALVAKRELLEESGVYFAQFFKIADAIQPIELDIYDVSPYNSEPRHQHYDICFLMIVPKRCQVVLSCESRDIRWFSLEKSRLKFFDITIQRKSAKIALLFKRFTC